MAGKSKADFGKDTAIQKVRERAEDDLGENEQEKIAILNTLREQVIYYDPEMRILWANNAACESAHMKHEDLMGRSCYEVWTERRSPWEDCPVIKAHETGQPQQLEKMTPDGRWWYIQGHQVRDGNGHVTGTAEITLDITDRKQAEEALRKAKDELEIKVTERTAELVAANAKLRREIEERQRVEHELHETKNLLYNTINALQDLVVVIDKDFRVKLSNWKDHDYISEKDYQSHPFCYEIFMQRETPCDPCHAREVFATGRMKELEVTNPIDGKIRNMRVLPVFDDNGKVVAVIEHLRDITERKRAEDALQESEERYRHLVDCARDIIYTVSSDATILSMNPAIENMTGWTPSEFTDRHLASLVHPDDLPLAMTMGQRALQGDKPPIHELRVLSKSGKYKIGEFSIAPFMQRGKVVGILGVGRDITIRKKLEKALKKQAHQLFERVKELNCLFGISELLEKAGHSLNQILQGIVDLIPQGWQYPEITCVKLDLHEKIYATKNFKETNWKQACDIYVHGDPAGTLRVCYLEERQSRDDGPFLKEEKKLLKSIAERVGKIVEAKQAHEDLQESEQRFHELVNNMSNGVAVYEAVRDSEDFIFVDFNKAGERIDNIKRKTLIGKSLLEIYPGTKEFGLLEVLQRVWKTGKPEHHPVSFYQDGRISGWRENYVYKLPSGEIVTVYDDITERIQAQEAMRKSEARYRALSEATFEAIFISEKGICLDTNQRATELFGYDYNELIGIFGTDVIATESKELVKRNMLSGYEKPYEAIAQKKDGTKFHVEICGKMMKFKDRDVRITVLRDINERKRAAEALRESEKRYRNLFNSIPIGLYRTTPEGTILDVNPTMLEILRYPDQDALLQTKSLETYLDPDDRKQIQRQLEEKGFVNDFMVQLRRHDGGIIWVTINTRIVHDSSSQMIYYEGAMADISDRKESEERIHKLSQQLMQAQEDERQLISRELHDTVAQDLSATKMACDLIYGELLTDRLPEAKRIKEISGAMQKTISDVRNMAYDLRPPGLEEMGLAETIYHFCEDFTQIWGVPVDYQSAGWKNLKLDYGNQINLYRLVQEALTNIRKHAAASRVTVKLAAAFPDIFLRIEDNGRGFDMQKRVTAGVQEKRMGLRSMQERVKLMNGEMKLQSKPGQGTKVSIRLPIVENKEWRQRKPS